MDKWEIGPLMVQWNIWGPFGDVMGKLGPPDASGIARAFPGGRVAHPEGQNEEENE